MKYVSTYRVCIIFPFIFIINATIPSNTTFGGAPGVKLRDGASGDLDVGLQTETLEVGLQKVILKTL